MPKQLLNEAELLLLKHWEEAYQLEQSLDRVREKYAVLLAQAADAVKQSHPELDSSKIYATQFWSKGSIAFGRKEWPEGDDSYRMPGFWLANLRLEVLAAEDEPPPTSSIWIPPRAMKKAQLDGSTVKSELLAAAKELLTSEEFDRTVRTDGPGNGLLYFVAPSKRDILDLFVTEDGASLVEAIVAQFDMLSKFVPFLDRLFTPRPKA
jgi:hypothetical protein